MAFCGTISLVDKTDRTARETDRSGATNEGDSLTAKRLFPAKGTRPAVVNSVTTAFCC